MKRLLVILLLFSLLVSCKGKTPSPAPAAVGQPAPRFALPDLEGRTVRLSDFRDKVVLIEFWATWCAPCVESVPEMNSIAKRFFGKDVVILGISVDEGRPQKIPEVLDGNGLASLLSSSRGDKATKLRNPAMIHLMRNTGLGASEVLSIRVRDTNFTDGTLNVCQGKGGKAMTLCLWGKRQAGPSPLSPGHGETGRFPGGRCQRRSTGHSQAHICY